ncbi:MAG: hypothetical protein ABSE62_02770 [Chthoniobacteraceae bacterium]|jgi:hypothetical protein
MKHQFLHLTAVSALTFAFIGANHTLLAQASVQTTTSDQGNLQTATSDQGNLQTTTVTSAGTISQFGPDTIVVKTEDSAAPVSYTYSKTTTYVDENGNPVSMEMVKSGLPVTVYYVKDGDNFVASKVVVKNSVVQPQGSNIQESKTTTTTTSDK